MLVRGERIWITHTLLGMAREFKNCRTISEIILMFSSTPEYILTVKLTLREMSTNSPEVSQFGISSTYICNSTKEKWKQHHLLRRWRIKQTLLSSYHKILLTIKKEWSLIIQMTWMDLRGIVLGEEKLLWKITCGII